MHVIRTHAKTQKSKRTNSYAHANTNIIHTQEQIHTHKLKSKRTNSYAQTTNFEGLPFRVIQKRLVHTHKRKTIGHTQKDLCIFVLLGTINDNNPRSLYCIIRLKELDSQIVNCARTTFFIIYINFGAFHMRTQVLARGTEYWHTLCSSSIAKVFSFSVPQMLSFTC